MADNHLVRAQLRTLPAHVLAAALPQMRPFGADERRDVLEAFDGWLRQARENYVNWQAAWNDWADATPRHSGRVHIRPLYCPNCRGRSFTIRHGQAQPCWTCLNGLRGKSVLALWQGACGAADEPGRQETLTPVAAGDRIRVTGVLPNDPAPIDVGAEGTVTDVVDTMLGRQIQVDWDNGRTLMLIGTDPFMVTGKQ